MKKIEFVNYSLDNSLLIILEDELPHVDDWQHTLEGLIVDGYKVSNRYDVDREGYSVYVTGTPNTPNDGKCLSAWGASLGRCYQKLHLIIETICSKGSWDNISETSEKIVREALGK